MVIGFTVFKRTNSETKKRSLSKLEFNGLAFMQFAADRLTFVKA